MGANVLLACRADPESSFFECHPNLFNLVRLSFGPDRLQVDGVETLTPEAVMAARPSVR